MATVQPLTAVGKWVLRALVVLAWQAAMGEVCAPLAAQDTAAAADDTWIGSWTSPPTDLIASVARANPYPYQSVTIRSTLRLSAGGDAIRVRLSNDLGGAPITIDAASVGVVGGKLRHALLFGGQRAVTIPAGQSVFSDPLPLRVKPRSDLSVSIYVAGPYDLLTGHVIGQEMVWRAPGDQTMASDLISAMPGFSRLLLTQVDVHTKLRDTSTIAILGDSITEGYLSTFDAHRRWPDYLIAGAPASKLARVGIVNLGISGNRLLQDGDATALVSRLDRDVWSIPRVRTVVMLIGVNDIGYWLVDGSAIPTFAEMQAGYRKVIASTHAHGAKVVGATIMPYAGYGPTFHSSEGEALRQAINAWILTSGEFDAVVDLDLACRAKENPLYLSAVCDGGDGLHPSDQGYEVIAAEVQKVLSERGWL